MLFLSNIFRYTYSTIRITRLVISLLSNLSQIVILISLLTYYFSLLLKTICYN